MPNPFIGVINSLLPEPQASLLNGILFGVKATMPKSLYQALVATGTLHIIALSGVNISILSALIARSTIFLGRKASSIISICLIVLFVLFVGASPSVVRAAVMGCLSLIAVYFGRQSWGLLGLVFTAMLMLLYDFSLLKNISFQLSFMATLGIILANKMTECQTRKSLLYQFKSFLKNNLILTFSAQIFTLPIILYYFHRASLIAPLANLLIEWTIQPIMILGFATSIIGWIWQPLGYLPAWLAWVPLTYLVTVVELLAEIPFASFLF